jgi:thiol-disulfide isomerase/thioredoxin
MSKEQTAEEFYNEHYKGASSCTVCFWTHEMVEQYAKAKVLEALEKHYKEVEVLCRNAHLLGMKETLPGYPKPETIDEWIEENL